MPNGDEQDTSDAAQPVLDLRPGGRRFAALAATSTLTTILSSALNFLGSLLPAYALGTEGKGQVAFLTAMPMMIYNVSLDVSYARAGGFRLREVFVPTLADLSPIKRLFSQGDNRASGEGDAP